jgi:hypothetical protein
VLGPFFISLQKDPKPCYKKKTKKEKPNKKEKKKKTNKQPPGPRLE